MRSSGAISPKHIGILGHSVEGSALCYLAICHDSIRRMGPHLHPRITLDIAPLGESMAAWHEWDLGAIRATLAAGVERLAAAGAEFFVCPDNTAHAALEHDGTPLALPGLHIAEVVADRAATLGCRTIGVLGTKWTMNGPVYPRALAVRGLGMIVPPPDVQVELDRIIFEQLCNGIFLDASRATYVTAIAGLKAQGCDAVALACTEIPLLVAPSDSPLALLDSTRLLAAAAVDVSLASRAMPGWRGGKVEGHGC